MDSVSHTRLDCQQAEDDTVSLVERHSSFSNCSTSDHDSNVIHIDEFNPSHEWKLPSLLPKEIYKLKL